VDAAANPIARFDDDDFVTRMPPPQFARSGESSDSCSNNRDVNIGFRHYVSWMRSATFSPRLKCDAPGCEFHATVAFHA
jgi:hypothetical protein